MSWLSLISGLVSLFGKVVGFFRDWRLFSAGKDRAEVEAAEEREKQRKKADAVWDDVRDPDSDLSRDL